MSYAPYKRVEKDAVVADGKGAPGGGGCLAAAPPPQGPPNLKCNKHRFSRDYIKQFYVTSTSSEISRRNRLMTSALEFCKIN
jgi:hypothetical protein